MVKVKQITDKKTWESFLATHAEANFLQSWAWGEFHEELGRMINRVGFYQDEKLIGVMQSIVEHAKRGTYLTVPAGPIIDWSNKQLVSTFKKEIVRLAKENNCSFVRIRPQLEKNTNSVRLFKNLGFRNSPMHLHAELTNQLDLSPTEEEILSNMRKGTRYEIKKAQKIGIQIQESSDLNDINKFYKLQLDTAKRQGFVPFSLQFLKKQFEVFAKENNALLYSAFYEKKLLAQSFIIFYGKEAVYHYGASTIDGRNYPGAYLIQWRAIQDAKKRGMIRYNFWGVANDSRHRFANLSLFKRGFGGVDIEYLHAQDYIISYPHYIVNYIIEFIRKKTRHV